MQLASFAGFFAGEGACNNIEKSIAETIEANTILKPGRIAAKPGKKRRQIGLTPLRTSRPVDGVVKDNGFKGTVFVLSVGHPVVGFIGIGFEFFIGFGGEEGWLLDVVVGGDNLIDVGGRDGTDKGHPGMIGADEEKEVAGSGELIA